MKRFLIILILISITFLTFPQPAAAFELADLINFFNKIFAPKYSINSTTPQQINEYVDNNVGVAKRIMPNSLDNNMKLQYIIDYVNNKAENIDNLGSCPGASGKVDLNQLAFFVLKNYQVPLDQMVINDFLDKNKNLVLQGSNACFNQIWNNFYNVPQGNDNEKTDSYQGNQVIREPIPEKSQTGSHLTPKSDKNIIKQDSQEKLDLLHRYLIPDQAMGKNTKERTRLFENFLTPEKEKKE
ncbi:MAG TPA: hypothetical protein PK131_00370 [Candidatus Woesebacteria bacterium]|nr:hypothetical protein [Candidatus Woesebacteria bacterium]HRS22765.1 hypothetical protein [Candidatus Woesebacteria bacterium]HRT40079.1 hypothetical protein [Candidatus Woesebacteria bacterium]